MRMADPFPQLLIAAARHHLRMRKKKSLTSSASLSLAGEILAVAAGLKPAFLYDYSSAGISQIVTYVQELQTISQLGCRLHVLSIAETVLIINLEVMQLWLETVLLKNNVPFIDVSASRTCPGFCEPEDVHLIKGHLFEVLSHIQAQAADTSQMLSSSTIFSAEFNLCTLFGVLLGYPAAYSFHAQKSFENCLSLTPLRVFTIQATFCKISSDFKVRFYSFSVPELLYPAVKTSLNTWCENLKDAFKAQKYFADLSISTEVVAEVAVTL
ncbi:UPF0739 protein C1orf74 homolog [Sceloporus undulatus]|uniref:UPF0739 protein C1orf74 homolog n=1 Tax=Sceloporus undulatus TaxID=8520 RepID=UPI001C4A9CD5|nr:UPF0739 protein C1orf74 homolog [Sceloporus undulatus]XP_042320755.1 UPF0739 protein C1orf74 homolog [Sceloporus undulatus]XP_042320756.1 UPF0739 protein C1orf74 homolog [Sceloporus undulatus]XP_042320757.1 UPF0739 protein C1orf74 homolog [Sceloporus undulatus]XP_042320758.1 UPF0739 protein C1orf74 homolog [Sceloporus undulatus]